MSGWLFLAVTALICLGAFLNGVRFTRMPENQVQSDRTAIELPSWLARNRTKVEAARLVGRIQMIAAPLFLIFFAALSFGLLGPVDGIQTIKLASE